ncbi:hypothetical protein PIB30_035841 [Stylosanthes scabra]|uniref:Uncharacterized protein n=1 Tax=Stylosanthes scabra TaxID=79078 RepID=A0ABU6ZCH6_9FABA|nr:hypothetical protein [Stylosanthes scabra]
MKTSLISPQVRRMGINPHHPNVGFPKPKRLKKPNHNNPKQWLKNALSTQEVIDLSSSPEEDRQRPMVPKEEQDVYNSPRSQMISSVLVSIRRDHQTIETPSFDLGVEPPLLTPQMMDAIDEIDDKLKKNPELLRTPNPLGTDDIIADMERKVAVWGTIPKGDNE